MGCAGSLGARGPGFAELRRFSPFAGKKIGCGAEFSAKALDQSRHFL